MPLHYDELKLYINIRLDMVNMDDTLIEVAVTEKIREIAVVIMLGLVVKRILRSGTRCMW